MTEPYRPVLKTSVVIREEFDDYAILYEPDTNQAYAINPVSVFICRRLDGSHTVEEITKEVRNSFINVPAELEQDLRAFLGALAERQILE